MIVPDNPINTRKYWDSRFATDWEDRRGRAQSRYFGALACDLLPKWLLAESARGLSWCDWGCAFGDGTNELAINLAGASVSGVDFSPVAIQVAAESYPAQQFVASDWLREEIGSAHAVYDVVFSSNTLEHFHDPWAVVELLTRRAKLALVLLLPYREWRRIDEHHVTFHSENIRIGLPDGKILVHATVRDVSADEPCHWPGEQILLVWVDPVRVAELGLSLSDMRIESTGRGGMERVSDSVIRLAAQLEQVLSVVPEDGGGNISAGAIRRLLGHVMTVRSSRPGLNSLAFHERSLQDDVRQEKEVVRSIEALVPWLVSEAAAKERAVAEYSRLVDERQALLDGQQAVGVENARLHAQLEELRLIRDKSIEVARESIELRSQLEELRLVRDESLCVVKENSELRSRSDELLAENTKLEKRCTEVSSELDLLKSDVVGARRDRDDAQKREDEARSLCDDMRRLRGVELALRDATIAGQDAKIRLLDERISELYRSSSWRITAPFRRLAVSFRALRWPSARRVPAIARDPDAICNGSANHLARGNVADATDGCENLRTGTRSESSAVHLVQNFVGGGLERVVLDLCAESRKRGGTAAVLTLGAVGAIADEAEAAGIEVCACSSTESVLAELRKLGSSVCFAHHAYSGIDEIHESGVRVIEVLHNAYHWQRGNDYFERLRERSIDDFVAVSSFVRDYSVDKLNIPRNRIKLINNGLNRRGLIRPPLPILQSNRLATIHEPRFVFVGNLFQQKNHLLVIQAFAEVLKKFPKSKLLMLGSVDGDELLKGALLAAVEPFVKFGAIELLGSVDRRRLSKELSRAHVALLPSQLEGFSIATLEFTYFGLPCVLSNTGASMELGQEFGHVAIASGAATDPDKLTDDHVMGRFYSPEPEVVRSLADQMSCMLDNYADWSSRGIFAAESYAEYSISTVAAEYDALASTVLKDGTGNMHAP